MRRVAILAVLLSAVPLLARAEVAPRSAGQLAGYSDLIVTGEVVDLTVTSERSRIESGFGNYDWIVALKIWVDGVEKGDGPEGQFLTAYCFRVKSRKSLLEFLSPSGHHPIPGAGAKVRAYLAQADSRWHVVLPNGLQSVDENTELADAPEVEALSCGFTYLLPLGAWILIAILGLLIFATVRLVRFVRKRRRAS